MENSYNTASSTSQRLGSEKMDVTEQKDATGHQQICSDLEKATRCITSALQHEVLKNQELWRLIRRLEDKEAETGRSLAEELEANKQLQLKLSRVHKHMEEKHGLLRTANQIIASQKMEIRALHQQLHNQHIDRPVQHQIGCPLAGPSQEMVTPSSSSVQSEQPTPLVLSETLSPLKKVDLFTEQMASSAEDFKTEWAQIMGGFELKVIVPDRDTEELVLDEKPQTIEELETAIRERCGLPYNFTMMYEDPAYGNALSSLDNMDALPAAATVLVVPEPTNTTPEVPERTSTPSMLPERTSTPSMLPELDSYHDQLSMDPKIASYFSMDLDLPSMSSDISMNSVDSVTTASSKLQSWPPMFNIPRFSADVELRLRQANESYRRNRKTFTCSLSMKRKMLGELAKEIYKYTAYPTKDRLADVARALIAKHPCLSEVGSPDGCSGWTNSLYFKMGNFRNREGKQAKPRKPKRFEFSSASSDEPERMTNEQDLEEARVLLVEEMKKEKPEEMIVLLNMSQTFALRRREVVEQEAPLDTLRERWPALFTEGQVFAEFYRITETNLSDFFVSLDRYTPGLVSLFKDKRGVVGETLDGFLQQVDVDKQDVTAMRTLVLRGLPVLLGDDPSSFYNTCLDMSRRDAWDQISIGLLTVVEKDSPVGPNVIHLEPVSTAIVIEGCRLMNNLKSLPEAVCILFGLLYVLNLNYPNSMKNTLNFIQRVLLGIGQDKLSPKLQSIKNLLLSTR